MSVDFIHSIERPHPNLLRLYIIRSLLSGPFMVVFLPLLWFRYHTLRYRFDDEGVSMGWGILFKREVNLTYARIQDIHLTSGPIQRWFGLADLHVQTASGSAAAEMVIEGLLEYEALRDFLYQKMRGARDPVSASPVAAPSNAAVPAEGLAEALDALRRELSGARVALERLVAGGADDA